MRPFQCWHGQREDGQEEMDQFLGSTRGNEYQALAMTDLLHHTQYHGSRPHLVPSGDLDHQMLSWWWQAGAPSPNALYKMPVEGHSF